MTPARADAATAGSGQALWTVAQVMGVVLTVVLLGALWWAPTQTLALLWNAVIPILPAVFLVNPAIWRNVCPLATLNMLTAPFGQQRKLEAEGARWFGVVGIVLLVVMVPARRFLFNVHGPTLAITIVAVAVLALLLGLAFATKAGFCNALCPVLPVEKLYGQRPLLNVGNPRCLPCNLCTRKGCQDLTPEKAVGVALGARRSSSRWLVTPYGAFAAAFPGFIVGYYTTTDGILSTAPDVYLHVALYSAVSYVIAVAVVLLARLAAERSTLLLAAAAVALYYWFAAPAIATALVLPTWWVIGVRVASVSLVLFWLMRAMPPEVRAAAA